MNKLCNNFTHDASAFGVAHYSKRGISVMGPSADSKEEVRTHKCSIRVPMVMSGKARYGEGAVYRDIAKPSTTLLALTTARENPDNTMPRK